MGIQPRSPAISKVGEGEDSPATPMGGWGCWNGRRCRFSSGGISCGTAAFQYLPSYFQPGSWVHRFMMMSMDSRVMSRCSPCMPSTPNISQSVGEPDAANPTLRRPPETVSYTHLRAHETPEHLVC